MSDWRAKWGIKPKGEKRSGRCRCGSRTIDGRLCCAACRNASARWRHEQTELGYFVGVRVLAALANHIDKLTTKGA